MNKIFQEAHSLYDAKTIIIGAKRRAKAAHTELAGMVDSYASLIEEACLLADRSPIQAKETAAAARRELIEVLAHLEAMVSIGATLGRRVIAASQAIDEATAQRKAARAKLGI